MSTTLRSGLALAAAVTLPIMFAAPAMAATPTILIAEDETAIAETVLYALRSEGFAAEHVLLGGEVAPKVRAGGIDLVTGIAQLFGIRLAPNFKRPYFSVSLGDFWRRWHISLGAWMRDYVFYPFALTRPVSRMSKALKKKVGTHIARALPPTLFDPA